MTDSINYKFDVPKEFINRILKSDIRKTNVYGLQVYLLLHSQLVYRSKAIAKLYTFDHLITRRRLKPKHMLRVLFQTLRVFVEPNPSNMHVTSTITELNAPSAAMKLR